MLSLVAVLKLALVVPPVLSGGSDREAIDRAQPDVGRPSLPDQRTTSTSPNIVLISTDDQTADDLRWMPFTRRLLGRAGVSFSDMVSPHPLCCPARAEILTGQYAQNNGVHSNGGRYGGFANLKNPDNTVAPWLYRAGYHTGLVGKFLNGYRPADGAQHGWESWSVAASDGFGYDRFSMYTDGDTVSYGPGSGEYSTDLITRETGDLIEQWGDGTDADPFFIWSSYYAPHGLCDEDPGCDSPPHPAARHANVLGGVRATSLGKPSYRARLHRPNRMIEGKPVIPAADVQRLFTARLRALQSVDEGVRDTVAALQEAGELENTYLIFTSDNGYLNGEHHFDGKVLPYEEAVRVPLLMRGPGIPRGVVRRQTVTTVDLAPTITALAGATAGRVQDGRNLLPTARRGAELHDDAVLIQAGPHDRARRAMPWLYRGVRTGRYTFTVWRTRQDRFFELFDRRRDPYQLRNIAYDARYRRVLTELRRRTTILSGCRGSGSCFRAWRRLPAPRR